MTAYYNIKYWILIISSLLWGINISAAAKDRKITTMPQYVMALTPDTANTVSVDMEFCIPKGVIDKRSRIIILPQLIEGDSTIMELKTIVADAPIYRKKMHRRNKLEGYKDIYSNVAMQIDNNKDLKLKYSETFALPYHIEDGKIIAVVTTDGCGECTSLDTLLIAEISNPMSLIDYNYTTGNPMDVPIKGKGKARLQFVINKYDINLSLGNNKTEMDSMLQKIEPVITNPLNTLESLEIYGMASADGPLQFNTTLSANRAKSARDWLASKLNLGEDILRKIKIGSKPEGWAPVLEAMRKDGHPDTTKVIGILEKYADSNDDVQEKYIRSLSCWRDIRNKYLQKDRKVEYQYSYTIKKLASDEELLYMYSDSPESLSENEFLKVASLMGNDTDKKKVYYKTLERFPQSAPAACNLSEILTRQENPKEAIEILERITSHTPESRYNLGLLYAKQRNLKKAYLYLKDYKDTNSAIVAMGLNLTEEAMNIMESNPDTSPKAEYVRAMIAAQTENTDSLIHHLKKACNSDGSLKERAKNEALFHKYINMKEIKDIIF